MCGRFVLKTLPNHLEEDFGPSNRISDLPQIPLFNVASMRPVAIVGIDTSGGPELVGVRWRLVPSWSKELKGPLLINARCETAATKPALAYPGPWQYDMFPRDGVHIDEEDRSASSAEPARCNARLSLHFRSNNLERMLEAMSPAGNQPTSEASSGSRRPNA